MKKHELSTFKQGEIAYIAGREFIVLDHVEGGVLVLQNELEPKMQFGSNNDFRISEVKAYLNGEYLDNLFSKNGELMDFTNKMTIDLKSDDGAREYGFDTVYVGLLTIEQYFKYNEFIPLAKGWWMTASPRWTPNDRTPDLDDDGVFWFVDSDGHADNDDASSSWLAPRPALALSSSLLASKPEDARRESYNKYLVYLSEFSANENEIGSSPKSFEEWVELARRD